ncbi:TAP42-like protein [Coniophora puteana RWD-64-598 SS2]|uniref:TAP42-like protein n=1 Tax=Coniophora puteana (strain RWD-64-598) TaxID=741705 RepID=A0A5M3N0V5_CONPW|nr:TAP42-like protein [Coniophora puteana RWD-64-598 SS2]EIW84887.1 TAP42-like protein [Coniophora puteana RWD-64-598 SS2]
MSVSAVYSRILLNGAKAATLSALSDDAQAAVSAAISDLRALQADVSALSLFSSNESLRDISTRHLPYLAIPFVYAEIVTRRFTPEPDARLEVVRVAQANLNAYVNNIETLEIVSPEDRKLYSNSTASVNDPAQRRELKIRQYKAEKEVKSRVTALRSRLSSGGSDLDSDAETDFDLLRSLLPSSLQTGSTTADDDDEEDDDGAMRQTALMVLRLLYAHAHTNLTNLTQELELLRSAPPPPPGGSQATQPSDGSWRLDAPTFDRNGPLLDPSGKPLRPFTILPAGAAERSRLQSQVFGPGHSLPTMSIDEYLEIERQRGNIIEGGGQASADKLTSSEELQLASEDDGTAAAEEASEKKRLKDEAWAQYTDLHPKGEGNTMNRG